MVVKIKVNPKQTLNPKKGMHFSSAKTKQMKKSADIFLNASMRNADIRSLAMRKQTGTLEGAFKNINEENVLSMKLDPTASIEDVIKRYYISPKAVAISYIYSANSRLIRGTDTTLAVKTMDNIRGWLTLDGKFFSEADLYRLLQSFDGTLVGTASGISLEAIFTKMNARQRAELFEELQDVDWEEFWEMQYNPSDAFDEQMVSTYYNVVDIVDRIIS